MALVVAPIYPQARPAKPSPLSENVKIVCCCRCGRLQDRFFVHKHFLQSKCLCRGCAVMWDRANYAKLSKKRYRKLDVVRYTGVLGMELYRRTHVAKHLLIYVLGKKAGIPLDVVKVIITHLLQWSYDQMTLRPV